MRGMASKPLCWLLVLLLAFQWDGWFDGIPTGQAAQPVSLALPSAAELAKTGGLTLPTPSRSATDLDDLVAHAEAAARSIPRVRYDVAGRVQALGPGVDPVFRFVRDQVHFEAYPGVLRGAEGTYVTRAGNAFDRSLLLANMLKRKGLKTRFALGRLPRPQAERLFAHILEPDRPLEADAVASAVRSPEAEAFLARLRARALRDYAAIRNVLGKTLPSTASPPREEVLKEIEQHVWVQAEVNGRWVDLDSAFPDAAAGRAFASPERTVETLPKERYQRVTIRVITETLTGSSLKSETALEFSATAEELLDRQIFLTHTPGGTAAGGPSGAIAGAVSGPDAWTPMLWVDGQFHVGKPISFSDQKAAERGRPPAGGLGGLFGAGGALASSRNFVAEWLEFEIGFPDGGREVTRRALIDRAGMAWRQAGKLDPAALRPLGRDADGFTAPRALHNIWVSAGRHNLAGYADALRLLASWARELANDPGTAQEPAPTPTFGEIVWPIALMNFALLVHSDHTVVSALNDKTSHRFYADSPRIVLMSLGFERQDGAEAQAFIHYDLRRDQLRGLTRDASNMIDVVERKIWFGILQGALEHEVAAQHADAAVPGAVVSTSSLLTGEGLVVFRPEAMPGTQGAASPETAARMKHAQGNGAVLVVPRQVLRGGLPGWWEIARNTSDTRAVLGPDTNGVIVKPPGGYPYPQAGLEIPGKPGRPPRFRTWRGPEQLGPKIRVPNPSGSVVVDNPYYPGGVNKAECRAGGHEYVATTGCISPATTGAVEQTFPPGLKLAILGLGVFVLGFLLATLLY
jgi:transglutaminase-like putative cysteine protease